MNGWYLFLIVLAVILLLLVLPVGLSVRWDDSLILKLKIGPFRLQLIPAKKQTANKAPKEKKNVPAQQKKKTKPNREQLFYSIDRLGKLIVKILQKFRRGIVFDPLRIYLEIAGEDPADTAVLYGKIYASASGLLPAVREVVAIRNQDIQITLNFDKTESTICADVGVYLRIYHILGIAFSALAGIIGWYLGYKKLASQDQPVRHDANQQKANCAQPPAV